MGGRFAFRHTGGVLRDDVIDRFGHSVRVQYGPAGAFNRANADLLVVSIVMWPVAAAMAFDGTRQIARVTADLPGCPPFRLSARPGTYFLALGRQDELLGHAGFDDRFIVKTDSVEAARLWLGPRELGAILATYDANAAQPFGLAIADGKLELVAVATELTRVDEAITAAALLGSRGVRLASEWAEHARQLGGLVRGDRWTCDGLASEPPPHAGFALEIPRNGVDVQVDFPHRLATIRHAGLRTRVWARHDDDTVAVGWRDGLPRASRPHVDDIEDPPWIGGLRGGLRSGGWLGDREAHVGRLIADAALDWSRRRPVSVTETRRSTVSDSAARMACPPQRRRGVTSDPPLACRLLLSGSMRKHNNKSTPPTPTTTLREVTPAELDRHVSGGASMDPLPVWKASMDPLPRR